MSPWLPIVVSLASLLVALATLYYTNFRRPRLRVLVGSRFKLNHPQRSGFSLAMPITITNQSAQPGHVHKISVAVRMPHVQKDYRYLDWGQFVVYNPERNSWDVEEMAHPFLVPGKSSVSKVIGYGWSNVNERFITEIGQYELQVLCWTSAKRQPSIKVSHSFSVTRTLKDAIDNRMGGRIPPEFANQPPPMPPGRTLNVDVVLDQQLPENTVITEPEFVSLTGTHTSLRWLKPWKWRDAG